jgi:putative acetyltransferase
MPTLLTMPVLQPLDPFDPQAGELLAASNAYMATLYPAESNHLDGPEVLAAPNVHFIGGWQGERLLACGAVKLQRDADGAYGEIKRVWVRPEPQFHEQTQRIGPG